MARQCRAPTPSPWQLQQTPVVGPDAGRLLVGGGGLRLDAAYTIFNTVLDGFVESHLRAEDKRLALEEERRALYKASQGDIREQ